MKWIPFSEQQPTPGAYLVTDGKHISVGYMSPYGWWNYLGYGGMKAFSQDKYSHQYIVLNTKKITHWMPLPSLPEPTK